MISNVILLRSHGNWRSRVLIGEETGARGWLEFRKANPAHYGRTWDARLLNLKDSEKDCVEPLHYARVLAIKEGGIMITGVEISFRGPKSKPVHTPQTWWCVVHHEEGYAALDRHNPRSSTGFHVNDNDDED